MNKKNKVAAARRKECLKKAARDKKMTRLRNIERNRKSQFARIQKEQMVRRIEIQAAMDAEMQLPETEAPLEPRPE